MNQRSARRPKPVVRLYVEGVEVDEGMFWARVGELAREGARAQLTEGEVRWRLTPKGEAMARLIRQQELELGAAPDA